MVPKLLANFHASSVYDIDPDFFKSRAVTTVIVDVDNALESYNIKKPSARAYAFKDDLKERGLNLVLYSHKSGRKAERYAKYLGVPILGGKNLKRSLSSYIEINEMSPADIILVGASIYTDSKAALSVGVEMILTRYLDKSRNIFEKVKRTREKQDYLRAKDNNMHGLRCPVRNMEVN